MATGKKKIYAVRKGRTIGLFETWEECKEAVKEIKKRNCLNEIM